MATTIETHIPNKKTLQIHVYSLLMGVINIKTKVLGIDAQNQ